MTDPADTPKILTLADGFYVRQAIDNIAWIDMGEYVLVVDALEEEAHLADEIFDTIDSTVGPKQVRYLINTHTHYDHVALNEPFRKRYGTEIINQQTVELPPDGRWFEGSKRRALMRHMPGCHTPEDCIVWLPDDRVLFPGDIFGWGLIPLMRRLDDNSADLLRRTYEKLIAYDADVVSTSHGPLCKTAQLSRWLEYFQWLCSQVSQSLAAGKTDPQIMTEILPPPEMADWWRFVQWKHKDSLTKVIRAVRSGKLPP